MIVGDQRWFDDGGWIGNKRWFGSVFGLEMNVGLMMDVGFVIRSVGVSVSYFFPFFPSLSLSLLFFSPTFLATFSIPLFVLASFRFFSLFYFSLVSHIGLLCHSISFDFFHIPTFPHICLSLSNTLCFLSFLTLFILFE